MESHLFRKASLCPHQEFEMETPLVRGLVRLALCLAFIFVPLATASAALLNLRMHSFVYESFEQTNIEWGLGSQIKKNLPKDVGSYLVFDVLFNVDPAVFLVRDYGYFRSSSPHGFDITRGFSSRLGSYSYGFEVDSRRKVDGDLFSYYGFRDNSITPTPAELSISLNLRTGSGTFTAWEPLSFDHPYWFHRFSANVFAYEIPELGVLRGDLRTLRTVDDNLNVAFALSFSIFGLALFKRLSKADSNGRRADRQPFLERGRFLS